MPAKTTPPAPPPAAVAADAHWAATQERLRARTRPKARLVICDDVEIAKELAVAQYALRQAEAEAAGNAGDKAVKDAVTQAKKDVELAQDAYDEASIVLTFQALPRQEYEALLKAHPATEEQAEDGHDLNMDTFGPALVFAASVDGMLIEDAQEYLNTWSPAEASALFDAAFNIQQTARMDLGKG